MKSQALLFLLFLAACPKSQIPHTSPMKDLTQLYSLVIKESIKTMKVDQIYSTYAKLNLIPVLDEFNIEQTGFTRFVDKYVPQKIDTLNQLDEFSVDTALIESQFPILILDKAKFLATNSSVYLLITRPIVLDDSIYIVRAKWYRSPADIHGRFYILKERNGQFTIIEEGMDSFVE